MWMAYIVISETLVCEYLVCLSVCALICVCPQVVRMNIPSLLVELEVPYVKYAMFTLS